MRFKLIFLLLIISNFSISQNLVNNPSFEEYYLDLADLKKDIFICKDWFIPNFSSIDYLNKTKLNLCKTKNDSLIIQQPPSNGNACIGFVLFEWGGYLEQIMGSLSKPLLNDSLYEISFKLRFVGDVSLYLTKIIGVKFSTEKTLYPHLDKFNPFYNRMYEKDKIKADMTFDVLNTFDTTNWIQYKGVYKAKGGEYFFTIGFFYQEDKRFNKSIESIQTKRLNGTKKEYLFYKKNKFRAIVETKPTISIEQVLTKNHSASYYLIDDVSIVILN